MAEQRAVAESRTRATPADSPVPEEEEPTSQTRLGFQRQGWFVICQLFGPGAGG